MATMTLDALKIEIEALPETEFAELRRWIAERDWDQWDEQLEADVAAGKLDFLIQEAADAAAAGTLREL